MTSRARFRFRSVRWALWTALAAGLVMTAAAKDRPKARKDGMLPNSGSAFFVTSVEDQITMTWQSDSNKTYTIIYTENLNGTVPWKILPGYVNMPGIGKEQTIQFREPRGRRYHYRLQVNEAPKPDDPQKKK